MDSSLGFKVISSSRADANMEEEQLSDGASTGFEVQGSSPDLPRTPSTISVDTASFHTADGIESDYPREYMLKSTEYGGDDLSSRLLHQGAQYFSATEGDSDSDIDDRDTLRADQYVGDPDQPKLALAEDSIQPGPASEKRPPPQDDEYRGRQSRRGNEVVTERSPLLSSSGQRNDEGSGFNCCTVL